MGAFVRRNRCSRRTGRSPTDGRDRRLEEDAEGRHRSDVVSFGYLGPLDIDSLGITSLGIDIVGDSTIGGGGC